MVLLQQVRATSLDGIARTVTLNLRHDRPLPVAPGIVLFGPTAIVEDTTSHHVLFSVQPADTISSLTHTDKSVTIALVLNVPADAATPRRLLEVWYPTDVDTGPLHLSRLKALDPRGSLTTFLLHDHEDNLFLNGWGMANEPVYNQHATAYLLRDDVKPAIRAFYSMLACAFSHSVLEPVEHRWAWGQYFGPPSTDGAWFDLYRHMLIHEQDDDKLLLLQATPRKWLEDGKQIRVERAPTYFGALNLSVTSLAAAGELHAAVEISSRKRPPALLARLRHPDAKPMREVSVNGQSWTDFDPRQEWVRIAAPQADRYEIAARY